MASFGSVTIALNDTVSSAITIPNNCAVVSIQTPAALTGTALTIQGSQDGTNFGDVYVDGTVQTLTVTTSKVYQISPLVTLGLKELRLVSGSTELAARSILVSTATVV